MMIYNNFLQRKSQITYTQPDDAKRKAVDAQEGDAKRKAVETLTNVDDVHLWALSLASDVRSIKKPIARKRLMHHISGILLDELEKMESQTAISTEVVTNATNSSDSNYKFTME